MFWTYLDDLWQQAAPDALGFLLLTTGVVVTAGAYRLAWGLRDTRSPMVGAKVDEFTLRRLREWGTE